MTLLKRILVEQRPLILPLVLILIVNIGAYFLVLRPLEVKSAGAVSRAEAASAGLAAAQREEAAARGLVSGKALATEELSTFYEKVVPPDLPSARRLTYAMLPTLARKVGVRYQERRTTVEPPEKGSELGRLIVQMSLDGSYAGVRRFIYEIETAPEFIIIDDVALTQEDPEKPLALELALSTYYRMGHGR